MIEIYKFQDEIGRIPFDEWISGVRDKRAEKRIQIRIDRLALGLEGDWKPVGKGIRELRISEGKGYRVYYAWDGDKLVILLCGGDKSSQSKDIEKAKLYWRKYHEHQTWGSSVQTGRLPQNDGRHYRVSQRGYRRR